MKHLPYHLLVIPDGDRTYAKKYGMTIEKGYICAGEQLINVMKWVHIELNIPHLTLFALAEYNLTRPIEQVKAILQAGAHFLELLKDDPILEKVTVNFVGELKKCYTFLPQYEKLIQEIQNKQYNTDKHTNVLIAYSGEEDLARAIQRCTKQNQTVLTYENIQKYTSLPIPIDMAIRTAGHLAFRLSGVFLGVSQARMYSLPPLFPELTKSDIENVVKKYSDEIEQLQK